MRAVPATAAITAVVALVAAAPALAQDPFDDFRRNGTINPCNYSDNQLRKGLQGLPPDIQQYAPGLADQLAAGRGGCGGGPRQATAAVPAPTAPGAPPPPTAAAAPAAPKIEIPAPPAPKAKARTRLTDIATPTVSTTADAGPKTPDWLLALLLCLSLGAMLIAAVRLGGWSPERFTRPLRASFEEAGGRTADAFAQLRDTVRLGR